MPVLSRARRGASSAGASAVAADVRAALPAWLLARVIVGASLIAARVVAHYLRPLPEPVARHVHQGLLGWDAQRYLQIAVSGYERLPRVQVRFFPLLPLLSRVIDPLLPGGHGTAILFIANGSALALAALLHHVALAETGDRDLARRAAWFTAVLPAGFVFVWGYTEALWALLAAGALFAARRGRWWTAALLAVGVGLVRPVGVLIALPLAIEALRQWKTPQRRIVAPVAAVAGVAAGTLSYLWWVGSRFGDPLLPYTIQQTGRFRGKPVDPITALHRPAAELAAHNWNIDSLRVGWAVLLVVLVVVCFRRWPLSYGAFAAVTTVVALSTSRLGSFERYGFTAFPIILAVATVTSRAWAERAALIGASTAMALYGLLALLGPYVP